MFSPELTDALSREDKAKLERVLVRCYQQTPIFAKTFMPERFESEFSEMHYEIFNKMEATNRPQRTVICGARGFGKTSCAIAVAAKAILYREARYILYVSKSHTLASAQTENIKRELLASSEVRKLFGNIKTSSFTFGGMDESFSKNAWVANGYTLVLPRGWKQQVRGLLFGSARPDLIIVDDFEDKKEVCNEEIRAEQKNWFFSDLMRSVSRYSKNWRVIYLDTLKHEDALINRLLELSSWDSLKIPLCNVSRKSLVPELISDEEIEKEFEEAEESGTQDLLYQELLCEPISLEDASFKRHYFQYYDEDREKLWARVEVENYIIVDPAKTAKPHSADSAIVCGAIDTVAKRWYFRDCRSGKLHSDEMVDAAFDMAEQYNAVAIAVEETGLHEFVRLAFENRMRERGRFFTLIWLKARAGQGQYSAANRGKEGRVASLINYYRRGVIFHNPKACEHLERQLLSFPRPRRWDVMDAWAYIVEIAEQGLRYFLGGSITDLPDKEECDYYDQLLREDKKEPAIVYGWSCA